MTLKLQLREYRLPSQEEPTMADFESYRAFQHFRKSVTQRGRYVREQEAEEFLQTVVRGASDRKTKLPEGCVLWRAQLGSTWRDNPDSPDLEALGPVRMKPRRTRATEGRVNPKGLPVLYLASTEETAMAEVRPSRGTYISLAQFKVMRDLTIVDFSTEDGGRKIYLIEPDETERDAAVWADIDRAFSAPTERSDDGAEYVATQVVSDAIRSAGYDGIAYRSGLENGHNIALFDLEAADLINCSVFNLRKVTYEFAQAGNPYFISKYYPSDSMESAQDQPDESPSLETE